MLCRYILRPPLVNERLHLVADGSVTVEFKRPWSDGTRSIGLVPAALISRMAALVPSPKRHVTVYSGVLASHSKWRRWIIPKTEAVAENADVDGIPEKSVPNQKGIAEKNPKTLFSKYIPWHELLRRTFGEEVMCPQCGGALRLIALVKKEETIQALLSAMHLPTGPPKGAKSHLPGTAEEDFEWSGGGDEIMDWLEYPDGSG
jgi:Putative transposase